MPILSPSKRMRDAEAVAKARQGEADGIAQLYGQYAEVLHRLIYRLTASAADSEDILHDLFVGLPEMLRRYEDRGTLGPWLRQVATRMTLMHLRAQRRRREISIDSVSTDSAMTIPAAENDASLIEQAVLELPEAQRKVFVLRQLEGYTYDEIGDLLRISAGAARVRYLRALRRMRQRLENS
jgi:RNA polymerase sigma-70 factor (ECF subfamily)